MICLRYGVRSNWFDTAAHVTARQPISIELCFERRVSVCNGSFNGWLECQQCNLEHLVEVSQLARPSCGGLSCTELRITQDWLVIVWGRTFTLSEEHLVLARVFAVRIFVVGVSGVEVLSWRADPSSQALSTVDQGLGRVSAGCVLGVWRSSSVILFINRRVYTVVSIVSWRERAEAAGDRHRLEAVKFYFFWRPAASWVFLQTCYFITWGLIRAGIKLVCGHIGI